MTRHFSVSTTAGTRIHRMAGTFHSHSGTDLRMPRIHSSRADTRADVLFD
jgi:hypothetical protein